MNVSILPTAAEQLMYLHRLPATGEWTKLPSVTPAHVTHARQIRKLFTGQLDASVSKQHYYKPIN